MIFKPQLILNKYINLEILRACSAILLVLILIFISGRFIKYIQLAVDGSISSNTLFSLLLLQIPAVAGFLLPLSFFVAILLTFGRLYVENEMAIIRSVGLSEFQLAKNIMPLAIILALISGGLSFWVTPWSGFQSKNLLTQGKMDSRFGIFSAGAFRENSAKNGVVFVESTPKEGGAEKLFAVSSLDSQNGQLEIQVAGSARFGREKINRQAADNQQQGSFSSSDNASEASSAQQHLVLEKGRSYIFDGQSKSWQVTSYDAYFMLIKDDEPEPLNLKNKSIATGELIRRGGTAEWAELHWRLSAPLSIPILCLLALPLSRIQPRKGKFSGLLPAILVYMVYALLMMNSRRLLESGTIPIELGFWWIHASAIGLCFWLYQPNENRFKPRLRRRNV